MQEIPNSISKRFLWRYVNKKINRSVHHLQVLSVITILFEELIKDLKNGKTVKIHNLGSISLDNLAPKKYFDIVHKEVRILGVRKSLKFFLSTGLKKKLCHELDLDKTFRNG